MTTAQTKTRSVRLGLSPPHSEWQREVIEYPGSICLLGGGRSGKTEAGVRRIIRAMVRNPGLYFWVGLSWQSASMSKAWRLVSGHWQDAFIAAGIDSSRCINRSRHEIVVPGGSMLMFRTAESPESIAGDGPLGIVGDEYPYWSEEVWSRFVQPSLADHNGWALMIGRPAGENWGLDLWRSAASRDGWLQRHVTIHDNPLLDPAFVADLHAHTPPRIWAQEYLAEPGSGDDGAIPLAWAQAAMDRWPTMAPGDALVVGVDVAEGGGDRTILAIRRGQRVDPLEDHTPREAGVFGREEQRVVDLIGNGQGYAIVDAVGVGAMLPNVLRRRGVKVIPYKGSVAIRMRDASGQFGFDNTRSASYWHLRELLHPDASSPIALPPDRELLADLTAPTYDIRAGAKIHIEEKDRIKKRIGRSPDKGDAVVMAFWDRGIMRPLGLAA